MGMFPSDLLQKSLKDFEFIPIISPFATETFEQVWKASDSYYKNPGDYKGVSFYNEDIITSNLFDLSDKDGLLFIVNGGTTTPYSVQLCKSKNKNAQNGPGPNHTTTRQTSWTIGDPAFGIYYFKYLCNTSDVKVIYLPFSDATINGSYYINFDQWGRVWTHIPAAFLVKEK